jgi:hypothetical protein
MKAYERMYIQLNTLTLVAGGFGKLHAAAIFTPANKAPLTHLTEGCMGPRTGMASLKL